MERKLIANHLVPDDEVWVSPATWERPFSLKAKESTVTDTQQLKAEICEWNTKDFGEWSGYATSCGERVQSIMPLNGMRYCPYCSRKLSAV